MGWPAKGRFRVHVMSGSVLAGRVPFRTQVTPEHAAPGLYSMEMSGVPRQPMYAPELIAFFMTGTR